MSFDTYFRITSYALIATAFAALSLTGALDLISILLYTTALFLSFRADSKQWTRLRLREWMWRLLALAYVPFVFIDGVLTSRVIALVHMTLFLSAAKLFQDKRDRDWVFLYLIAFFQMLLAAGLTFDTTFIASLGFFIFFFISTLAVFEIRLARREVKPIDEEIVLRVRKQRQTKYRGPRVTADDRPREGSPLRGRVRYLVGASLTQMVMVGALTLPFFFLIPRFGGGLTRGLADGETLTGFSESVQLRQVAKVKENQKVAMRIKLDRKPNRFIRWRGVALDYYTGYSWSRSKIDEQGQDQGVIRHGEDPRNDEKFERDYSLIHDDDSKVALQPLEQKIILEATPGPATLFAAARLMRLRGPIPNIKQDKNTRAVRGEGVKGRIQYMALSDISIPGEDRLRADSSDVYPEPIGSRYRELPGERVDDIRLDSRIRQLALNVTREAHNPYDKAKAVEAYLRTQFAYTLDLNFTKRDPLSEFLFEAKAGHCEYFATAMAVMMRTVGIPARIVNGFQMGDYNDVNDLYTVRASDAHSWVEVYFVDTKSWVEFDPTPAAGINDYSQGGVFTRLKKYMEAAEVFWLDYIVTLDSEEQATMMVDLQHRLLTTKDRALDYYESAKRWFRGAAATVLDREWDLATILKLLAMVAALVAATAGLYVTVAYSKRRRRAPTGYGPWWHRLFILPRWHRSGLAGRNPRASAVLFYEQMLAIAARAGLIKKPEQTPLEFAEGAGFAQIDEITAVYNRVRFGGARLDETDAKRVSRLLADLKRESRWETKKKNKNKKEKQV